MIRILLALTLCLPGFLQAQDKKKSPEDVWNELFAKREGKAVPFNKFLADSIRDRQPGTALDIGKTALATGERYGYRSNELPQVFGKLRLLNYEDTRALADWDRSGGKPVPVVRLLAIKETAGTK